MSALAILLEVQEHDTAIDQLRHRRVTLPERAELADLDKRKAALVAQRAEIAARRDEIASRQSEAEREIAASEERMNTIDVRMRSGTITATKDLQAMEHEIASLKERVSSLEDAALEAMDEREPLDSELAEIDAALAEIEESSATLRAAVATAEVDLDAEVASEEAKRQALAATVDGELLATYEKLRTRLGGVGAARLDGNRCTGCHLTLPATELDRLRHAAPDALAFCEQCGRILVHS